MKRKIAVCLSGQPRTYKEVARNIRDVFEIPEVDVDYYIHAWTEDSSQNIRMVNKQYDRKELQQSLEELYQPKGLEVEHWTDKVELGTTYWFPKTYSMFRALDMCYTSNIRYDIVVWTRLDMYRALDLSGDADYRPLKFDYKRAFVLIGSNQKHVLYAPQTYERGLWCENVPIVEDREFWGRPEEMKVLRDMYQWYKDWFSKEDVWREPRYYDCAEHTWALYLVYRGIWVEKTDILGIGIPVRRLFVNEKIDLYSREGINYIANRGNGAWDFNPSKCKTDAQSNKLEKLSRRIIL